MITDVRIRYKVHGVSVHLGLPQGETEPQRETEPRASRVLAAMLYRVIMDSEADPQVVAGYLGAFIREKPVRLPNGLIERRTVENQLQPAKTENE